ncbi:uncharacterized protein UHOD_16487 [Ustilago sp. UG-2017b]|nr:uncharacterized protein UHOD_16487 [Ustilago sp. UG-2017b]
MGSKLSLLKVTIQYVLKDTIQQGGDKPSGKADLIGAQAKPIQVRDRVQLCPTRCRTSSLRWLHPSMGMCRNFVYISSGELEASTTFFP